MDCYSYQLMVTSIKNITLLSRSNWFYEILYYKYICPYNTKSTNDYNFNKMEKTESKSCKYRII